MPAYYLILLGSIAAPALFVIGVLLIWRYIRAKDKRRSPLTNKILNLPGEQLRRELAKLDDGYNEASAVAITVGPIVLSAWLLARMRDVDWSQVRLGAGDWLILGVGATILLGCSVRMVQVARNRRKIKDGLEAELAVAQSLSQLQLSGALVFHDFPCGRFNIDHIVIGRSVVFAVETKSRRKSGSGGAGSAKITYDGDWLTYANGVRERAPIEQARRQAAWLGDFLGSGVGEAVRVVPLVALPGWYVELVPGSRPEVLASNCHNPAFMMGDRFGAAMSEQLRTRIAHVLRERYPELELEGGPQAMKVVGMR